MGKSEFSVTDTDNGLRVIFPIAPDKIAVKASARFITYDILSAGEVKLPQGEQLTNFSWSGILPGVKRGRQPYIVSENTPETIWGYFSQWRINGTKLLLCVTNTPINDPVYLVEYTCEPQGGYGDVFYSVNFVLAKTIHVNADQAATNAVLKTAQPPSPAPAKKTYTVKSGDTLWAISQKMLGAGSKYMTIYNANKTVLEAAAKAHGKSSSDTGHWIYPGQVLTIS